MIEQLLALFASVLWLSQDTTGTYYWSWVELTWYLSTWDFSYEINLQEIQKTIIIEDYFRFISRLGKINYARGCAGEATPPVWDDKRKKRARCWVRSFDCWGMMKYYWRVKWIINQSELSHLNSETLYWLWEPKDPRLAERWDFMYWTARSSWFDATHFAVITTGYNEDTHELTIMDNYTYWNPWKISERKLKVSCNSTRCMYMGKYNIKISTNWMVEEAQRKQIQVNAFKIVK